MAAHDAFKAAVESMDIDAMTACFTPDATFHSPAKHRPFEGRDQVMFVLRAVSQVFSDFHYLDVTAGERTASLIFQANVGDKVVQGLDHLTFDDDGMVTNLTVMVRPYSGMTALLEAMNAQLEKQMAELTGGSAG